MGEGPTARAVRRAAEGGGDRPAPVAGRLTPGAALWLLFFCAIWGLNMVAIKVGNRGLAPATGVAFRSAAAAVLLGAWMIWRGIPLFHRGRVLFWGAVNGLFFAGEFFFLFLGLADTQASRGMILLYTSPFFITLGAHFLLRGDRLSLAKAGGLAAAFLGTASVLGQHAFSYDPSTLRGDLFCLTAGVFWAAMTLTIKRHLAEAVEPIQTLWYQLFFSLPLLVPAALILEPHPVRGFSTLTTLSFLFQVVVVVLISYLGWFTLLHRYSASRLSSFLFVAPVMGTVAGTLLLGEPLPPTLLAGLAGVGAGIWLVNR